MIALPPDFGVDPAPGTRLERGVLSGGTPPVRVDVDPAAAAIVDGLLAGSCVGSLPADGPDPAAVARRLVALDLAAPRPGTVPADVGRVAGVIPAKDAAHVVAGAVAALAAADEIIVVDDGSSDETAAVADGAGARVLRHTTAGGPARARNAGAGATDADVIVFLDADTDTDQGWLERLLAHLRDPHVGGAAPRITAAASTSLLGRYERASGALDLGPEPGLVRPEGRITFVSTTALVVRRSVFDTAGGFDETLRFGEDLDFVWRLAAADQPVVYEPRAVVRHHHRPSVRAHLTNQFRYASASGPLDERHGLPRAGTAPATVTAGTLAAVGGARWAGSALVATGLAGRIRASTAAGIEPVEAVAASARAGIRWLRSLAAAFTRPWLPLALAAAWLLPRARPPIAAAVLGRWAALASRREERAGTGSWLVVRALEDLAHSSGTLWGCVSSRRVGPLLPGAPDPPTVQHTVLGREVARP